MIEADIIARLLEAGTPFAIVEGANELAEIKDRPKQIPAAFVYVSNEVSAENERMTGPALQRMETDIAVVIVTENAASREDAARDIATLKAFVRAKLMGFKPPGAEDAFEHVTGQIVQAKDRMVWFEDVYATAVYIEEQP